MEKLFLAIGLFILSAPFSCLFSSEKNIPEGITVLSPSDPLMDRGITWMNERKFSEAIGEFSQVIQSFPMDARYEEALFQIGECYRLLGRDADALQAYQHLEKQRPNTLYKSQLALQLGLLLGKLEKYSEAIPYLEASFKEATPELKPLLRYSLGLALLRQQKVDQAIPLLDESSELKTQPLIASQASWALADYYEKQNKLPQALNYWSKTAQLTEIPSLKAQSYARSGWILLQMGKNKEARPLFEKTREFEKKGDWRTLANTALIQIAYEDEKFEEVIKLFKEDRQNFLDYRRAEIFFMAGLAHHRLKNHEQANQILGLFLKNFPDHPQSTIAAYTKLLSSIQVEPKGISAETAAFLSKYPQSEYASTIKLLRAQDFNSRKKFNESLAMWEELKSIQDPKLPREQILLERARAYYEVKQWLKAAEAFQDYIQEFPKTTQTFQARFSKAIALQQAQKNSLSAWEEVRIHAPLPSPFHQLALEQIGLLASQNKNSEKIKSTFEELLQRYPESTLAPTASFQLGLIAIQENNREKALLLLDQARKQDPRTWEVPATQRMVYLAYELKKPDQTLLYLREFEALLEKNPKLEIMPAAIYYWLGETDFKQRKFTSASIFFAAVNSHPQPGELRHSAWWYLAECQRENKLWKYAIASYERFQKLEFEKSKSNEFLLSFSQAHLGAKNWEEAQKIAEKVMIQDPEGKSSAQARFIVAETHEGRNDFVAAAKAFAALAVLYQDPYWTPRAMHRASLAFEKINDDTNAQLWNDKLLKQYPDFRK